MLFAPGLLDMDWRSDGAESVPAGRLEVGPFPDAEAGRAWLESARRDGAEFLTVGDVGEAHVRAQAFTAFLRDHDGPFEATVQPTGDVDWGWPVFDVSDGLPGRAALPPRTVLRALRPEHGADAPWDHSFVETSRGLGGYINATRASVVARKNAPRGGQAVAVDTFRLPPDMQPVDLPRFVIATARDSRKTRYLDIVSAHEDPKAAAWSLKRALLDPDLPETVKPVLSRPLRPRDAQRERLYRWESGCRAAKSEALYRMTTIGEAREIVARAWALAGLDGDPPPVEVNNRLRKTSYSSPSKGMQLHPEWGLQVATVLHEAAHEIARTRDGQRIEPHGPEFAGTLASLYGWWTGLDVDGLVSDMEAAGLRVDRAAADIPTPASAPSP